MIRAKALRPFVAANAFDHYRVGDVSTCPTALAGEFTKGVCDRMATKILLGCSVLLWLPYGLFTARFAGFLLDAIGSPYTYGTLVFESSYALVCGYLLRSMPTLQVT